jgi:hypothetical protein
MYGTTIIGGCLTNYDVALPTAFGFVSFDSSGSNTGRLSYYTDSTYLYSCLGN